MQSIRVLSLIAVFSVVSGCMSPGLEIGQIRRSEPYPGGMWAGPIDLGVAEKDLAAHFSRESVVRKWLLPDHTPEKWREFKAAMRSGDEIWAFAPNPFVLDGPRDPNGFRGYALIRDGRIVACVVTSDRNE